MMPTWRRTLKKLPRGVRFEELDRLDSGHGQQAVWIYERSFPADEREPLARLEAERTKRDEADQEHHFRIMLDDDDVVGISVFTTIDETYMGFLRYIAMHEKARNGGLGRLLLADVLHTIWLDGRRRAGFPYIGVAFEVERPADAPNHDQASLRDRRIQWYKRNGARLDPKARLLTPPVSDGQPAMPYHLMFCPAVPKIMLGRGPRRLMVKSILEYGYEVDPESVYVRRALGLD